MCIIQILVIYFTITYFYNLWKYSNDFNFICFYTILSPLCIGEICTYYTTVKNNFKWQIVFVGCVYRIFFFIYENKLARKTYKTFKTLSKNVHEKSRAARIIENHNYFIIFFCVLILYLVYGIGLVIALSPFLMKLFTNGKVQHAIPLYLIGLDPHTTTGFTVNFLFQCCAIFICVSVVSAIECLVVIYLGTIATQIEVLRSEVRQFEVSILMEENYKIMRRKFIKIVDEHNKLLDNARSVEKLLNCEWILVLF